MAGFDKQGGDEIISAINVTPLVDIMLVLLIIFMLVSTFVAKEAIEVELPHAATGKEIEQKTVSVLISKDGDYYVSGTKYDSYASLKGRLEEEKKADATIQVVISADKEVRHGSVVKVVDMVRRLEIYKFAINVDYDESE